MQGGLSQSYQSFRSACFDENQYLAFLVFEVYHGATVLHHWVTSILDNSSGAEDPDVRHWTTERYPREAE